MTSKWEERFWTIFGKTHNRQEGKPQRVEDKKRSYSNTTECHHYWRFFQPYRDIWVFCPCAGVISFQNHTSTCFVAKSPSASFIQEHATHIWKCGSTPSSCSYIQIFGSGFAHLSPKKTSNTEAKVSGRSLAPFVGMPPRNNKPPIHGQVVASSLSRRSVRKRSQDNNNIQRFSGFWVPIDSAWKSLTTRSPNLDISQKSPDHQRCFWGPFFRKKKISVGVRHLVLPWAFHKCRPHLWRKKYRIYTSSRHQRKTSGSD